MYGRFTEKAEKAINLSQEGAMLLGHSYVGTEHLLLGLVKEGTGVAARVLQGQGITEEKILEVLKKVCQAHTILSISHRLSSMVASDTVVILENGRVKNAGSPEILLESDEWYRSHLALEKLTWG